MLTNQEGSIAPGEPGAVRGMHVLLVEAPSGRVTRSIRLSREARAILGATAIDLILLFADGIIERVPAR
jgi:hypothetical protein